MVTTYTSGSPVPTNAPSQDVVDMQNNSIAVNEWVGFDHIGFNNDTNTGLHRQVTFNANESAPGIGSGVADAYVNTATGLFGTLSTLFFQNASQNFPLTNLPLLSTGSNYGLTTPWGLILNFGKQTVGTGLTTFTFKTAFTSASYALLISPDSTTGTRTATGTNPTFTTFQAIANQSGTGFWYLAIGS